ncbi:bifunctional lysylphosphatidylglycerol flippase/synthetase MprF [Novosphingobium sp. KCTC 2891]|uniref:bifunctional lysylphosphatidylglycerol flippase/synthetase MprF n=1 Tax=Novosphingobium sp. KCTC 2891 TaxID=2989730 RepID=UPI00222203E5|nr:bifunctional lysylphosphatidylglycerol flippase/synthetase MprF [Novosphingobium sp. KCTC 2891]MCW1383580.1 bifunctional lysylphosphatidylglycerol flippase/synthetase MprF [Novosphingobium sp. KCTC 2891]
MTPAADHFADWVAAPGWRPVWRTLAVAVPGALVAAFLWHVGARLAHEISPAAALAALRGLAWQHLALAIALTAASYLLLTFYDRLAQRLLGVRVPINVTMRAAFTSYALSHTLGFGALTGGSARLRIYGRAGVPAATVAKIVVIAGVSFWIGVAVATGAAMLSMRTALAFGGLKITPHAAHAAGLAVLAAVMCLIAATALRPAAMARLFRLVEAPGPSSVIALALVSTADLACSSLALYVLLPHAEWHFARFMLAYAMGITLGLVTHVPGGIGVFEAVILAALGATDAGTAGTVLAALLAYRVIYYFLPLVIALLLNGAIETAPAVRPGARLFMRLTGPARRLALALSPAFFGAMSFAGGLVLLLSGALPAEHARLHDLVNLLPLPFIETSHLAASLVGTGLLLVAPALAARLASGMRAARVLFFLGAMFSLAKGLDFEEAAVMLGMATLLQLAAPAFYRGRTGAFSTHNLPWLIAAAIAVMVATGIGTTFYNADHFRSDLWWHFALYGDGSRALRASFGASVLVTAFAMREWMTRPRAIGGQTVLPADVAARAMAAAPRSDAALAFTGDKRFLIGAAGDSFLMFRPQGRTWVVMGDPVGPRARWSELVWDLRRLADLSNALLCFYQASEAMLPVLVELGLSTMKYGEEAIVDPQAFTLQGSRMKGLRNSHARAVREGLSLMVVPRVDVPRWLPLLAPISDGWLAAQNAQEKGFSLGRFDPLYLTRFDMAVVMRGGAPVAFANLWRSGDGAEMSVDLMRQSEAAPPGTMDFLLVELILLAGRQGCSRFNLGLAPLSGLPGGRLAPFWARLARVAYDLGGALYNFAGLRFYKQKFMPAWESRYVACPQGPAGFFAVGAVIALVSGGGSNGRA